MSTSSESMEVEEQSEIKPDRQHIITCSDDASLRLWNLESGAQIGNNWQEDGDQKAVATIALSPNSKTVASGNMHGIVKLWDIETGKVTAKWTGHTKYVGSVRWSVDDMRVASGSGDGTVRVWEIETGETVLVLGPINSENRWVNVVAYSPDSSNIATGGDKAIEIWDTTTGERLSTLQQDSWVRSLAWTLDQKKLIAGFRNGSIMILNTITWDQIAILEGHTDYVFALSLLQNDRLLASASFDRTARLWNLDTNLPVGPPLQHQYEVWDAALSADGKFLVTACDDNNAYVWDTLTILKDSGFEDLLSLPNVAGGKSILNANATRRPKKPVIPRNAPFGFFEDTRDGVQTPNIPPAMTPADIPLSEDHSDPLASTTPSDSPPTHRHRRNIFTSFSVSGARSLLRRIFPHSQPRVNSSMNLPKQPSSPPLVSVHEPPNVQVPEEIVNELDAPHRPSHDERYLQSIVDAQDRIHPSTTPTHLNSHPDGMSPSSRSSQCQPLGRISGRIRGSHPNTNESTKLREHPTQRIISHHEPAIVEVSEGRGIKRLIVTPQRKRNKFDMRWARCIFCASTQQEEVTRVAIS